MLMSGLISRPAASRSSAALSVASPREVLAAEVAVGGSFAVDRLQQIHHLDQAVWAQIEEFAHQQRQLFGWHFLGTEGFHHDGGRFRYADSVRHLNLAAIGQAGGNDVFTRSAPRKPRNGQPWTDPYRRSAPPPWRAMPP